jgi:uncharacterized membrane protein HdeD (DUF308 family)
MVAADPSPSARELLSELARYWWIPVVIGGLAVLAGILVLVYPGRTLLLIELAFGIYLLFYGFLRLADAFLIRASAGRRVVVALLGVLAIIAGIFVVSTPGFGLATLAVIFGIWLIAAGVIALMNASRVQEGRGWEIARGIIDVIAGVIIVVQPDIGLVTLAVIGGIYLILVGLLQISAGFTLRSAAKTAGP